MECVQSIHAKKLANMEAEMSQLQIKIRSRPQWSPMAGSIKKRQNMESSGSDNLDHWYGVAFIMFSSLENSVVDFLPPEDRIMLLKLRTFHHDMNIIETCAPTSNKVDEVVKEFYPNLEKVMKFIKKGEISGAWKL